MLHTRSYVKGRGKNGLIHNLSVIAISPTNAEHSQNPYHDMRTVFSFAHELASQLAYNIDRLNSPLQVKRGCVVRLIYSSSSGQGENEARNVQAK